MTVGLEVVVNVAEVQVKLIGVFPDVTLEKSSNFIVLFWPNYRGSTTKFSFNEKDAESSKTLFYQSI